MVLRAHWMVGVGGGGFAVGIAPYWPKGHGAHNTPLSVFVELGVPGLSLFVAPLFLAARALGRAPRPERVLWGVAVFAWATGACSLSLEYHKLTWLLFAFLIVETRLCRSPVQRPILRQVPMPMRRGARAAVRPAPLSRLRAGDEPASGTPEGSG